MHHIFKLSLLELENVRKEKNSYTSPITIIYGDKLKR